MASSPDQLTNEIAETRTRMGGTMDEVGDRVAPGRVWERRQPEVRSRLQRAKESVMGSAEDAAGSAQGGATMVRDRVAGGTEGNPLAAGIMAFGAGLLAGSVLPSSRTESKAVHQLQEDLEEPVREAVSSSAGEIRESVGDTANDVMERTRGRAEEARGQVSDSARQSAETLSEESRSAAQDVRRDVEGR